MDNLTHSLVGWAMAETGLKHRTRKGLAACLLAANMPDIDVFFGWAPWAPLAMHRGFTHGLVGGVLLMPPLLAGLLWLLDRWQAAKGRIAGDAPPMRFVWLVVLSYLGAITHPLLDLQNVYAVQLMSPLSERWFHTDGLFIVSPWLLALLGCGIWLARRGKSSTPAIVALGSAALFIAANVGISMLAARAARMDGPYANPDRLFAAPEPLAFWRRDIVWREGGKIVFARYDPLQNPFGLTGHVPPQDDNMADPLVRRASTANDEVRDFLAWSQMPMAQLKRNGNCTTITFGDGRFTGPAMSRNFNVSVEECADRPSPLP